MSDPRPDDVGGEWLPDGTGIHCSGQTGGDAQVGESFSVRFRRSDRPGAIITRTAYPVHVAGSCRGQFLVRLQTEWLVCNDPADPGGTEVWSDNAYDDEAASYGTIADAERAAQNTANELLSDAGSLSWDGLAPCGSGDN